MGAGDTHAGWSEDSVHRWLSEQPWPARLRGSRGHDAAVLASFEGAPTLCADQCIEGVHFLRGVGGRAAGRKAVLRTLSDLAATAADPVAVTLTLAAPSDLLEQWVRDALGGAQSAAAEFGVELVAGDLAVQPGPVRLSVTALGRVAGDAQPVGRDRAKAGQLVLLSGPVGGSLGPAPEYGGRHLEPRPRFDAGRAARDAGATAMMDVSDGLAWDLFRLARASGASIHVDAASVPLHADAAERAARSGRKALEHGLGDGEDHELIATIDSDAWERSMGALVALGWCVIGAVREGDDDRSRVQLQSADTTQNFRPGTGGGWDYAPR